MKRRKFESAYFSLFFHGERVACFFNFFDLVDYVRRSVAGGCSFDGWTMQHPDGSRRRIKCDVDVRFDTW